MEFTRQMDVVTEDQLNFGITLIGAGAIGSFTALNLAKLGCSRLEVWDHDSVEEHNIPNQLVSTEGVGSPKVEDLRHTIEHFTDREFHWRSEEFTGGNPRSEVLITAVDSLDAREQIWENLNFQDVRLLIDPRMGLGSGRIYSIKTTDMEDRAYYEDSLTYEPSELPCTARSIVYAPSVIGGYIAAIVKHYALSEDIPRDILFDVDDFQTTVVGANES